MTERHALREVELAKELAGTLGKLERGDLTIIRLLLHDYRVELVEECQEAPDALTKAATEIIEAYDEYDDSKVSGSATMETIKRVMEARRDLRKKLGL